MTVFGDYAKYIETCSEEDFLSGKVKYDYKNIPSHSKEWENLREGLIDRCTKFVEECEKDDGKYENDIPLKDYKNYVIKKSNWLKEAAVESYKRFEENEKTIKENEIIHIEDISKKEEIIKEKDFEIEYYKKEFNQVVEKMEQSKKEIELIKSSKWWKLRKVFKKSK